MRYSNIADVAESTKLSRRWEYYPLDYELTTEKIGSSTDDNEFTNLDLNSSVASISIMWDSVMKIVEEKQRDAWEILSNL